MSSFEPGFDFAAANARATGKGFFESAPQAARFGRRNRHARQHGAFENLVHSSGLKFCLFAMTTSYSLLTHKLYQTSMVRWPQCPLWVISGPLGADRECPLNPPKRTCSELVAMSAKCHLRTCAAISAPLCWGRPRSATTSRRAGFLMLHFLFIPF